MRTSRVRVRSSQMRRPRAIRYQRAMGVRVRSWCDRMPIKAQGAATMKSRKGAADAAIIQPFGSLHDVRIGLSTEVRHRSVRALNRLLAHAMAMRDLYKKAHWQTSGSTFYGLHLMFDKHYERQLELIDSLAERVQLLGGVALATAHDLDQESR